jgi:uncharacterized repeat protein (TIGR03803 family)
VLAFGLAAAACSRDGDPTALPPAQTSSFSRDASFKTIYSFGEDGRLDDGSTPLSDLITIGTTFYGTTQTGGTTNAQCYDGCGTVFDVTAAGAEHVLYRFSGGSDGASPLGGVIEVDGTLFGTTVAGGGSSACANGCGTVFALSPNGKSEKVLYAFTGGSDGGMPAAGLIELGSSLYGTTASGGTTTPVCPAGCGTVFEIGTSGGESVVYRFKGGKDGAQPQSRLIAVNGTLYGTTEFGGAATEFCAKGCGTLFQMSAGGSEKIVHAFKYDADTHDGAYPLAGATALNGDLFGTTSGGGAMGDGTVFKANASSGSESVLHSFICCQTKKDGEYPFARLTRVTGTLYGTTRQGGTGNKGVVFSISASGSEQVLYDFDGGPAGALPQASLLLDSGLLYGTAAAGGAEGEGTVFALAP